jgi:hypothetical protein
MNTTSLELTDTIENKINLNKTSTEIINVDNKKKSGLDKINLFCKNYIKLLKLVFKSIIPDLKSFKCWQALILILFATFMVVFSVLVSSFSFSY